MRAVISIDPEMATIDGRGTLVVADPRTHDTMIQFGAARVGLIGWPSFRWSEDVDTLAMMAKPPPWTPWGRLMQAIRLFWWALTRGRPSISRCDVYVAPSTEPSYVDH
jgi:hypothetical protein